MRAMITGARGFLGKHLLKQLLERRAAITVLVRRDGALPEAELAAHGVRVVIGDVLDRGSIEKAAEGCEVVFHCAGKVSRRREDAGLMHRVHVEGTKNVLDAAKVARVRRVVVASTSGTVAVTEDPDDVRSESAPTPTDILARFPYYLSKLYAEQIALERSSADLEVVAVCPTLLLGPGDLLGSSTTDVVDLLEERIPFAPAGGMSFVDARDAATGMILAAEKGRAGERYLLHAQNLTLRAFAEKVARVGEVKAPALRMPRSPLLARLGGRAIEQLRDKLPSLAGLDPVTAEMSQFYWYVDSTKARNELGWTSRDPMETLVDTVDDLKKRGVVWPRKTA
ncbi:MAG: NAD-dependent epimerase/dehydratase family protein [Polyangiaceae bacterium]